MDIGSRAFQEAVLKTHMAYSSNKVPRQHGMSDVYEAKGYSVSSDERKKAHEEAGMEPKGEGNTPATGTKQMGYIAKYVPRNFPDKIVIGHRYCSTYDLRSIQQAATVPTKSYVVFNTNSTNNVQNTLVSGAVNPTNGAHQPNQRDNWSAQFGYYRVEEFRIKISASNVSSFTSNEPGITNTIYVTDGILSFQKTQQITDVSTGLQENLWEQKQVHNEYIQGRSAGAQKTYIEYSTTISPEDYDMDPVTTAGDETWTAYGSDPTQPRLFAISLFPAFPSNTVAELPEVAVILFVEIELIVQWAGYKPALRQAAS